jgi:hypothetical protein
VSSTGRLGTAPWGAVLARPGGDDGSGGPVPGTVVVTAPITGDGSAGTPVGISAATETAAGSMSAADKTRLDNLSASWPLATTAYFAVDFTGGSDATGALSLVSMAAAGATAFKTWAGLLAKLPPFGAGRKLVVAVKPRDAAGTSYGEDCVINWTGYRRWLVRGTTDFSDNAADKLTLGGITQTAGPGVGGVWTLAAGSTVASLNVTSATLPAEFTATGFRVRFTGNVTAALANIGVSIHDNTAGNIVPSEDCPTAPATGDTFLIERPGATFDNVYIGAQSAGVDGDQASTTNWTVAGLRTTGANGFRCTGLPQPISLCFCESTAPGGAVGLAISQSKSLQVASTWAGPDGVSSSQAGFGFRTDGIYSLIVDRADLTQAHSVSTGASGVQNVWVGNVFRSSVLRGGAGFTACGILPNGPNRGLFVGSTAGITTQRRVRVAAGKLSIDGGAITFSHCDVQGAGAQGAVVVTGVGTVATVDDVTGTTGNTAVGIDVTGSRCRVRCGQNVANTVTGSLGDVRVGGAIGSHTGLTLTNLFDAGGGNEVDGTAGQVNTSQRAVTNSSGGALAVGNVVRSNGTTSQVTKSAGNSATIGDSSVVGIITSTPANGATALAAFSGYAYALFDGAPTVGAIAYLSPGTAGALTTTVPAIAVNNNKLRVGRVLSASASTGYIAMSPENLATIADGNP